MSENLLALQERRFKDTVAARAPAESDFCGRDYKMIETLEIKNFRCFESVSLSDLKRINVITGANATGKTAFFEALYAGSNATGAALQNIRNLRTPNHSPPIIVGAAAFPIALQQNNPPNFEGMFRATKSDKKISQEENILISFSTSEGDSFELKMFFQKANSGELVPVLTFPGGAGSAVPLILRRTKRNSVGDIVEQTDLPISINQFGQLQQPHALPFGPTALIFGSGMDYSEADNVAWFSLLKEKAEADLVISFIRKEFPFIRDIEVLAPPPGINGLYATMADGSRRRVTSVSSGIYKIISILLACAHTRGGIIIIDEIENGIFYEKYEAVWRILYSFAKETNNQIFVSSHSSECLRELALVIDGNESDFSLLRTQSSGDSFTIRHISGKSMKSALKMGGEIRG
jgi:predicted ATPase